jgi:hypothetical protein
MCPASRASRTSRDARCSVVVGVIAGVTRARYVENDPADNWRPNRIHVSISPWRLLVVTLARCHATLVYWNGLRHGWLVPNARTRRVHTFTRLRRLSRWTGLHVRRRPRLPLPERAAVPVSVFRWAWSHRQPMSAWSSAVPGQVPENPLAARQSEIVSSIAERDKRDRHLV